MITCAHATKVLHTAHTYLCDLIGVISQVTLHTALLLRVQILDGVLIQSHICNMLSNHFIAGPQS